MASDERFGPGVDCICPLRQDVYDASNHVGETLIAIARSELIDGHVHLRSVGATSLERLPTSSTPLCETC